MKKVFFALAGFALAASLLAELSKYKDWDKSPEAYFLTPAERAEWKKIASDEDAEKFVAIYYAKRGGETFKQEIARRIAAADQQFKMARYKRGAESMRGRLLVTLGAPSRVSQSRAQEGVSGEGDSVGLDTRLRDESAVTYTWTYDKDRMAPLGLPELRAQVAVDNQRGADTLQNQSQVDKAIATTAEKSIVNPNATAPPAAPAGATAPPKAGALAAAPAAAPPAPAAVMPLPAAAKAALEAAAGQAPADSSFWSGTFRSPTGETFLALQFYLRADKPAFAAAAPLKFGAVLHDETGKEVGSYWEDASLAEVSEGSRKDRVFDHSVVLPPGSYKGVFGLFASEGQPPVASSTVAFKLDPPSGDFAVSPLILSNALVPVTRRPNPTDAFVFGTEKPIKVEPKGDRVFSKTDSLWYFYAVANPVVPGAAADAPAAPSTTPTAGSAAGPAPAAETPKPRVMTKINVQKDGQDAFAPFSGLAELQPIGKAYYGTGSEIPLASFEPGYYSFLITVRDLNAAAGAPARTKGVERKEDFVVLMPDGSLPPKSASKAAAPTPKPKKP